MKYILQALLLVIATTLSSQNLTELQILNPIDPHPDNSYGASVSISGDFAIVGSVFDDDNGTKSGSAYIYKKNTTTGTTWDEVKKITPSDAAVEDQFGYCSISGDVAVVGSVFDDDNGGFSGSAYIFSRNQGGTDNWGEVKKITASDGTDNDRFGGELSISGDNIAVGVRTSDENGLFSSGAVYIYSRNQGGNDNWGEVTKITPFDADVQDNFGSSVSLDGDLLIVGAQYDDTNGSAYIFGRNVGGTDNWGFIKKLVAFDAANEDRFGEAAKVEGNIAVVGAYNDDDNGFQSGSAYIYGKDIGGNDNWGLIKKLAPSDGIQFQYYGRTVEKYGDIIAVTADGDDDNGQFSGSVYLYQKDEGGLNNWGEIQKIIASDGDEFGIFGLDVAVSDEFVFVGSSVNQAYVFGNCTTPNYQSLEDLYNSTNGDQWTNNDGWLVDCDYCNWYGVTCDGNQNVIGLNLQNNNLSGTLPPSICQLGFLQNLILNENLIGGDIPSCLGQLSSLIRLVLNTNNFTGPIPAFTNTPSLITLQLAANELTGTLPSSLGNLSLLAFAVNDNNLTGCFDANLSSLCTPQIFDINVTPGNSFDASWADFCGNGDGVCMTDCCGNAKVIGSTLEESGAVFKEVDGVRLLLSTTLLGSDTYAVISKLDNNNAVTWSRRITEASQFLDFTINDDGNIIVIGRTTPVSVGQTNQCIMGIINSNTGAVISMKKHEFFGRQTFSKILRHDNPIDASFPYYIIGIENGSVNNTNANDDVIMLNVGEQLQVNWSSKYIKSNDNQWSRDIIGLSNGNILVIGDEDGVKGMFVTIDGSTGDVISVMETTDNRSFSEIIEVAGGNFISVGRSGAFTLNNGMLCYLDSSLGERDAIHFDGAIKLFYSVTETSPGTFIAAGTMLDDKTVLVEFTIPTGTIQIQIQKIKYLDHDGDASSRAYINYANGQLLYTESVQNHPMQFGGDDLFYASLSSDLSDDCFVDIMFPTVSDAFTLSSQSVMKEPLTVDVGQNMSIGLFDYDLTDACQTVSTSEVEELKVNIYPNPNNGIFTIESEVASNASASIFDITGKLIQQNIQLQGKAEIDLSHQNAGLYFIRVMDGKGAVSTHKVVVGR